MRNAQMKVAIIAASAIFAVSLLLGSGGDVMAYAAGDYTQQQTVSVTGEESDFEGMFDFPEALTADGRAYELSDITYEEIGNKPYTVTEGPLAADASYQAPESVTVGGTTYVLCDVTESAGQIENGQQDVLTYYDEYNHAVTTADVPATKDVTAENPFTGEEETVTCQLTGITEEAAQNAQTVINITYEGYGSESYEWNGQQTSLANGIFAGQEQALLAANGITDGTITSITWDGEPYTNANGVLCRNATAQVSLTGRVWRANYAGIMSAATEGVVYTATYMPAEYTVVTTAHYADVGPAKQISPAQIAVGVGAGAVIVGVVAALASLAKKKKKKEEA